ncbi:MAG: hypothetical protein DME56_13395 [Verrucomicrobia bacterium]|nr:MAG: hypothetical protein DME56_13395 [Verrucomicrobiota bacterium]
MRTYLLACSLVVILQPLGGLAQNPRVSKDISDIKPDSCRFEQSFSDNAGKTWEVNWVAIDERVKTGSDKAP